ncbi:competence/damage-inducible protein A [Flavimarina sp. Hel_I_48]|uniref:competence/damage-inducible protein A n=1 Tax=Flavimarina sp. Hel_I_48 TaxID=1392488 RepID=UPI0004DF4242|nr:competence/damage-inducible protein A [Flavimarina sp. Hel_I_48]
MRAHIIAIGDEILIGQIIDTNSSFIASALDKIGIGVTQITSISDTQEQIVNALAFAKEHAEVVLITGGLGPTKDDVTKQTFCTFFDDHLVENAAVLKHVENLFKNHVKRPMLPSNKTQALVPSKATVLNNAYGTAPGMWMEQDGTVFIAMPGVPYEMKALITDEVLPRLQKRFKRPFILHKTLQTYGMGESEIAATIEEWENQLPVTIKLAYLPSLGKVRLRLSTKGNDLEILERALETQIEQLKDLIGDIIVGYEDGQSLEFVVGTMLKNEKSTLSLAESCTGGQIASTLTAIPGSSAFFKGGMVTYATQSKIEVLGLDPALINKHSVVSAEVAEAMARQAKAIYKTDYALSTTGNAGPTKGDADVEVGTVFIGFATPDGVFSQKFMMGNHRERVITKTVNKAMELLQKELLKK